MDPETLEALRRSSGLALTKEGVWTWGTGFVENPRVQTMFHAGVAVRDDGELTLSVGQMWAYIKAEVTAFFVRNVADGLVHLLGDRTLRGVDRTVGARVGRERWRVDDPGVDRRGRRCGLERRHAGAARGGGQGQRDEAARAHRGSVTA